MMKEIPPVKVAFACFVFLAALFASGDLVVAIYSLFVTGLVMYFLRGRRQLWKGPVLLKIGGVVLFMALIYPMIGGQLALVAGFVSILMVFKKGLDGRFSFGAALLFLIFCPILLAIKQDAIAEGAAIFAYYFLATGTIQEIVSLIINRKEEDRETEKLEIKHLGWT